MLLKSLLLVCLMGLMPLVIAEGEDHWRMLHASSQNLGRKIMMLGRDTAYDPEYLNPELPKIEAALSGLVKSGELKQQLFQFDFQGSMGDFFDAWDEVPDDGLWQKFIDDYG